MRLQVTGVPVLQSVTMFTTAATGYEPGTAECTINYSLDLIRLQV